MPFGTFYNIHAGHVRSGDFEETNHDRYPRAKQRENKQNQQDKTIVKTQDNTEIKQSIQKGEDDRQPPCVTAHIVN